MWRGVKRTTRLKLIKLLLHGLILGNDLTKKKEWWKQKLEYIKKNNSNSPRRLLLERSLLYGDKSIGQSTFKLKHRIPIKQSTARARVTLTRVDSAGSTYTSMNILMKLYFLCWNMPRMTMHHRVCITPSQLWMQAGLQKHFEEQL